MSRIALVLIAVLLASPAVANNEIVHRNMTDRAWHIMMLLATPSYLTDPATAELAQLAKDAIPKYKALPARLPKPRQERCVDPEAIKRFGPILNWNAPSPFEDLTAGGVPYPINTAYITGNDCGVDPDWSPGAFFDEINASPGRDHTGVVLGFWAQHPDAQEDDWHLQVRPTNLPGAASLKEAITTILGAGPGAVYITAKCLTTCIGDLLSPLGTSGDCQACINSARNETENRLHEAIADFDGLFPGFGSFSDAAVFGGMGHHLNVVASTPGSYDDRQGLLFESAGPLGTPDALELALIALIDWAGVSIEYDDSLAPKRYQIVGGADHHADSVARDEADWEVLTIAHTDMTALDNMAKYGWREFLKNPRENLNALGWALHAFGDAIAPQHVVGTFAYGHRPYEDAFADALNDYLFVTDAAGARNQAADIIRRAAAWRKFITDWRAIHPARGNDVPIRDMVTELALRSYSRVSGVTMLQWPYLPQISTGYPVPLVGGPVTKFYFRNAPNTDPINRALLAEGIAAELAFLLSAAENWR
jgi:hypothetical protein